MSDDYPDALREGTRVAEYKILRVLGQGGFGITYLGFDLNLNGPVALKEYFPAGYARRLPDGSVGPISREGRADFDWGRERVLDEARAINRFDHPNVVHARSYIEARGSAFIVMDYIEGDSLAIILERRPQLTFAEWQPLFEKLLDGLEHVHEHNYLHRDLKPGNIVVRDADGAPVLIDFGSARIATGERTNRPQHTPGYAPIEQYGGGEQGPSADLYALAAVSYRVLLGERPPAAPDRMIKDTVALLEERVHLVAENRAFEKMGEFGQRAARRRERAGRGWLAALDRCLARQPKDRPQSVAALRKAVRRRSVSAVDPKVRNYRDRFEPAKSGRGKVLVADLPPPFDEWAVRRWVGRRSSGELNATVFAPFHRRSGIDAGETPLFEKEFDRKGEGFAWLFALEKTGAIESEARERIKATKKPSIPRAPRPPVPKKPVGTPEPIRKKPPEEPKRLPEETRQTAAAVLWLWYGVPVAAAMCDFSGSDAFWLGGVALAIAAVVASAAAFRVGKWSGSLMLGVHAVILAMSFLGFQQEWAWALGGLYLCGGTAIWWVGTRFCWKSAPAESGNAT